MMWAWTTQAEKTQAEKHQVAPVQQRAEQHEPQHRLAQQPHLLRSQATQAEKTQAEKHQAPAQLGPSGTARHRSRLSPVQH